MVLAVMILSFCGISLTPSVSVIKTEVSGEGWAAAYCMHTDSRISGSTVFTACGFAAKILETGYY